MKRILVACALALTLVVSASAATSYSVKFNSSGSTAPAGRLCPNQAGQVAAGTPTWVTTAGKEGAFALNTKLPANTSVKQRCNYSGNTHVVKAGVTRYYTLMIYVPSTKANNYPGVANSGWGRVGLTEPEYTTDTNFGSQDSVGTGLLPDGYALNLCTGSHTNGGPACPYNVNPSAADPTSSGACVPGTASNCYIIPKGSLTTGWHKTIWAVNDQCTNGSVQGWWKGPGASTYTQTVNLTGIPTLQCPLSGKSGIDTVMAYRGPSSAVFDVTFDDFTISDSYASAVSQLP